MHRIVHLDLKGAPLKVPYLEKVILCIKSWGATGVLIEWEDTFPYQFEYEVIGSSNRYGGERMYTMEEVKHILRFTRMNGLEPIQLVQSIGHLEFLLKHPCFQGLREDPRSPGSLCPMNPIGRRTILQMIHQIIDIQPDCKYIHIGGDEVFHYGTCNKCRQVCDGGGNKTIFMDYIKDLVLGIKANTHKDTTILIWDDMLRSIDMQTLKSSRLAELVQPVLWYYNPIEHFAIDNNLFDKYSQVFPTIWAGSAYKGANGSCKMTCDVRRYYSNHVAWLNTIKNKPDVKFSGIILTGWSRFDHYATLCELMPVSLSSLANCLLLVKRFCDTREVSGDISSLNTSEWPGFELANLIETYAQVKDKMVNMLNDDHVSTWLNPWQVRCNYTNPVQVEGIYRAANELTRYAETLKQNIETHLKDITDKRTVDEWIYTNCTITIDKLKSLCETARVRSIANAGIEPRSSSEFKLEEEFQ